MLYMERIVRRVIYMKSKLLSIASYCKNIKSDKNDYTDSDMFETEPTEDIEKLKAKKLKTEINALYGKIVRRMGE